MTSGREVPDIAPRPWPHVSSGSCWWGANRSACNKDTRHLASWFQLRVPLYSSFSSSSFTLSYSCTPYCSSSLLLSLLIISPILGSFPFPYIAFFYFVLLYIILFSFVPRLLPFFIVFCCSSSFFICFGFFFIPPRLLLLSCVSLFRLLCSLYYVALFFIFKGLDILACFDSINQS